MPEEYIPQSQQQIDPTQAYGQRGAPQTVPTSNEDFFSLMDSKINEEPAFPEEQMSALREKFEGMKVDYANGDKEDQAMLEADVIQTGTRLQTAEQFKVNLASMLTPDSGIGHNPTEKLAEYTDDMINIVNGNNEVTYDGNVPGYELHDGWTSMDDIEKLVKNRYVDEQSKNMFQTIIQDQQKLASSVQPGENTEFNLQKAYSDVKTKIIEMGDIRSLATDRIFGNRVFKDDLMSAIESGKYADFGLNEAQVVGMDPTPEDNITPEDTTAIVSSILQDENILKEYLTDYYVKAIEQNYYDNLNQDVRREMQWKNQKTPQSKQTNDGYTPQTSYDGGIKVKGGVIKNGIFMPNK